jgi:hypothetical protein
MLLLRLLLGITAALTLILLPLRLDYPEFFTSDPDSTAVWVAVFSPFWAFHAVTFALQVRVVRCCSSARR